MTEQRTTALIVAALPDQDTAHSNTVDATPEPPEVTPAPDGAEPFASILGPDDRLFQPNPNFEMALAVTLLVADLWLIVITERGAEPLLEQRVAAWVRGHHVREPRTQALLLGAPGGGMMAYGCTDIDACCEQGASSSEPVMLKVVPEVCHPTPDPRLLREPAGDGVIVRMRDAGERTEDPGGPGGFYGVEDCDVDARVAS